MRPLRRVRLLKHSSGEKTNRSKTVIAPDCGTDKAAVRASEDLAPLPGDGYGEFRESQLRLPFPPHSKEQLSCLRMRLETSQVRSD